LVSNDKVIVGNWCAWRTHIGVWARKSRVNWPSGTCAAGDIQAGQTGRVGLEARIDVHHHLRIAQRQVNQPDLPLAERVIQRVVDRLRRDAEAAGLHPVDLQPGLQASPRVDVADHVDQLGQFDHALAQRLAGLDDRVNVGAGQPVLIARRRTCQADIQVLHSIEKHADAGDLLQLRAQPVDHGLDRHAAHIQRLQAEPDVPDAHHPAAHVGGHGVNRRVRQHRLTHELLQPFHLGEGDAGVGDGDHEDRDAQFLHKHECGRSDGGTAAGDLGGYEEKGFYGVDC
jgi:hypothetical protein